MLTNCICPSTQSDYCGHYVVLCGFDADKRCVYYKNPSFNEDLCCAKFDMFETARHSYGTDEDIVFVKLEEPELMKETFINGNDKIWDVSRPFKQIRFIFLSLLKNNKPHALDVWRHYFWLFTRHSETPTTVFNRRSFCLEILMQSALI